MSIHALLNKYRIVLYALLGMVLGACFLLVGTSTLWAREELAGIKPEDVPLTGKLVTYGPATFIGRNDFTELKNFRYFTGGIGTRYGMTPYTTGVEPNGNEIVKTFPFQNDNEFHLLAASTKAGSGTTYWRIDAGAFAGASTYCTTGATSTPVTTALVRDTLVVGDSAGIWVWSGESTYPMALLVQYSSGASTVYTNHGTWINDGSQHTVIAGCTVHVGYTRPFDGFQADKDDAMRTEAAFTSSATEYFKGGLMYYWATYVTSTGGSTFELPRIKTTPRQLGTSWDGSDYQLAYSALFQKTGTSEFKDFTLSVAYKSENTYMDLSEMTSGGTIYLGFPYKPRQIKIYVPDKYANTATSSVSGYYWNGSNLTVCPSWVDGTSYSGRAFAQTGIYDFDKITNWEKRTYGSNDVSLYYLVLKVSGTLSNYVRIFYVTAIPDYDSPNDEKFTGVAEWNNRLVLYNGRDLSKILVSPVGQPDCFIGSDAVHTYRNYTVGRKEKRQWVGGVGDSLLLLNETENWVLEGKTVATMTKKQLSGTVACIAPESVAKVDTENGTVVLYQGRDGVYALSFGISLTSLTLRGSSVKLSADIASYWEPGHSKEIPASWITRSRGWYDKANEEYNLLVASGSGATCFTERLVFAKTHKKWSVYVANDNVRLSSGSYDVKTAGDRLHLGGGYNGKVYTLESGSDDAGYTIVSDFTRKPDMVSDRLATRNEIRGISLRYSLAGTTTTLSGVSVYLYDTIQTSDAGSSSGVTLSDLGWKHINLTDLKPDTQGFYHKLRIRFPGRINLRNLILWTRELPWRPEE